jgi:3-methylcrotonyl-CoA carboxylase alpha subunit
MFAHLLIANRGEIACRIAATARRLGIESIAVFSDADAGALHVRQADRALRIGPPPARESYLNIAAIIDAARRSGAEAVHPGYGFLSENPEFADACVEAGLVFVGPPGSAMRAMGSKASAKSLMQRAGVPVLPGYHGEAEDAARLAEEAARVGFPLVVKAVAGGGGRGMRVVRAAVDFAAALAAAQQEARSSFGNARVLIERYLDRPRHVEVQVFADAHGNAVHLFERDCSAQRRHQKVIEEAPAPDLDAMQRDAMGEAAVAAARAVGYIGAGTVEFVLGAEHFFFLEMNTRLQVEHPVTECVTGFDLVEWQLRIAANEPLPASGGQIALHGHAMEARLYAEDPARGFAPAAGRLAAFRMPKDARVDTGYAVGDAVGTQYDAMLAKVIVHAQTREQARRRLLQALAECDVAGVPTNLDLLSAIAAHPVFVAGAPDTDFVERALQELLPARAPPPAALAAAALGLLLDEREAAARAPDAGSPWAATDNWWLNTSPERAIRLHGAEAHEIGVRPGGVLRLGELLLHATAVRMSDGTLALDLDGVRETAFVTRIGTDLHVRMRAATWRFRLPQDAAEVDEAAAGGDRLLAPIPGTVTQVLAEAGATVARGETMVVLEAMKTVFRLAAPADAVVAEIACRAGDTVQEGQLLVRFAGQREERL